MGLGGQWKPVNMSGGFSSDVGESMRSTPPPGRGERQARQFGGFPMHRFAFAAVALLSACGSAPPGTTLAGIWTGNALISLSGVTYGGPFALQVTVSGNAATISGICGGAGTSVGPGTVSAPVQTLGTGTYAAWSGTLSCPAQTLGRCDSALLTYQYASVLAGVGTDFGVPGYTDVNSISFSARGYSAACGVGDVLQTSFIGTAVPVPL